MSSNKPNKTMVKEEPPVILTPSTSSPLTNRDQISLAVKPITGKEIPITISKWAKVKTLKKCIQKEKPNIKPQGMTILYQNKELEDQVVLADEGVTDGAALNLLIKMTTSVLHESDESASEESDTSEIEIESGREGSDLNIDVNNLSASGSSNQKVVYLSIGYDGSVVVAHPRGSMSGFDLRQLESATPPNTLTAISNSEKPMTAAELVRYRDLHSSWDQLDDVRVYSEMAQSWDDIDGIREANRGKQCAVCDKRFNKKDSGIECEECNKIFCIQDTDHLTHDTYF